MALFVTLKFEFHIILHQKNSFDFFQPFKNVNTILSPWAVLKQVVGC